MSSHPGEPPRRPTLALTLDLLIVGTLLASIAVGHGEGFSTRIAGVQVSAHDPFRLLAASIILLVGRLIFARDAPFLGISGERWRRWRDRLYVAGTPAATPTRPSHLLWATLGLCAVGAVLLREQLQHMNAIPDPGDPLFSMWRLAWVFHQMQGDPRALFDTNIFYPHPLTLAYSDSMLLPALVAAPLFWLGVHPVLIYNLMFVGSFLLSGMAMFLLAAHVTGSRQAAFVSALIFAFYPYRFEHYSHMELQFTMWMPLGLLALHRFVETARARFVFALAACIVAQLYSSMYYGVFFVLYVLPVVTLLIAIGRPQWRRLLPPAIAAGVLALACAYPLIHEYSLAQPEKGDRGVEEVTFYSAEPRDYFEAHQRSLLYGDRITSHHPERALFPGAMAIGGTLIGLAPPFGPATLVYGAALATSWELSLGFHGQVYPLLYKWLSPMRGLRVTARFSVLVGMTLALLSGLGAKRLLARFSSVRARQIVLVALTVATAIDLMPRLELERVWGAPPPIYASLPKTPGTVLAEFPVRQHLRYGTEAAPFMYFSIWHWTNMINGYSGFSPKDYGELVDQIERIPDESAIEALRRAGVTHVTMNCALYASREGCMELMDSVDRTPSFRLLSRILWRAAPVALYELLPGPDHSPLGSSR